MCRGIQPGIDLMLPEYGFLQVFQAAVVVDDVVGDAAAVRLGGLGGDNRPNLGFCQAAAPHHAADADVFIGAHQ